MDIEKALQHWFVSHRKKLAFAESCTGGMLSTLVTAVPGASEYFIGSFVVYSNGMKERVLGVPKETIAKFGAVSEETSRAMLEGVFEKSVADFAIAVTGFADPSVGKICAAVGERGKSPDVSTFQVKGDRHAIIVQASKRLLEALLKKVERC